MLPIVNSARRNKILQAYAAFNNKDWPALATVLCENVVWHPMNGDPEIVGRDGPKGVVAHLEALRTTGAEAELLGVALHGTSAISLDFTFDGPEGDHACADRIEFDASGCIKEVWHCSSGTHGGGFHAGHPAGPGHTHP